MPEAPESEDLRYSPTEALRAHELYQYYAPSEDGFGGNADGDVDRSDSFTGRDQSQSPLREPDSPSAPRVSDGVLDSLVLLTRNLFSASRAVVVFADTAREYLVADSDHTEWWLSEDYVNPSYQWPKWKARVRSTKGMFSVLVNGEDKATRRGPTKITEICDRDDFFDEHLWKSEWPEVSYYAGLALRSQSGVAIGALCVLDDTPRPKGLGAAGQAKLRKMAGAVMQYLELVRGERDKKRARRLEIALSRFVAGTFSPDKVPLTDDNQSVLRVESTTQESDRMDRERDAAEDMRDHEELERRQGRQKIRSGRRHTGPLIGQESEASSAENIPGGPADGFTAADLDSMPLKRKKDKHELPSQNYYSQPFKAPHDASPPRPPSPKRSSAQDSPGREFNLSFLSSAQLPTFMPKSGSSSGPDVSDNVSLSSSGSQPPFLSPGNQSMAHIHRVLFSKASRLIHEALDIDGVAFISPDLEGLFDFDAPCNHPLVNHFSSDTRGNRRARAARSENERSRSGALGYATTKTDSGVKGMGFDCSQLNEAFVRTLTQCWPRGCIFYLSENDHVLTVRVDPEQSNDSEAQEINEEFMKSDVIETLKRFLPDARCCTVVPLYDFVGQVFAVSFLWTKSSTRVFKGSVEGSFLAAFGNALMAEVSRSHAISGSVSKGNFISSISHELRSPLHGVLASCELLGESTLDHHQRGLVDTIVGCGRTLLDTIEHLLTFTHLNKNSNDRRDAHAKQLAASKSLESNTLVEKPAAHPVPDIDLVKLVEEVVEALHVGYGFGAPGVGGAQDYSKLGRAVYVNINVDPKITSERFAISSPGAFRRLVLNLCTNAIKNTTNGHVTIKLSSAPEKRKSKLDKGEGDRRVVALSVSDSGCGMPREFLKTSLFTPFVQQNPSSSGIGLGMSIVRQIVGEMEGDINVQSQEGVGTEMNITVSAPFATIQESESADLLSLAKRNLKGKRVTLACFHLDEQLNEAGINPEAITRLKSAILRTLIDTFGMHQIDTEPGVWKSFSPDDVDFVLAFNCSELEEYLDSLDEPSAHPWQPGQDAGVPLIEMGVHSSLRLNPNSPRPTHQRVARLARPFGPFKLAASLLKALEESGTRTIQHPSAAAKSIQHRQKRPKFENGLGVDGRHHSSLSIDEQLPLPPTPVPRPDPMRYASSSGVPHILIAEDNSVNMRLLGALIKKCGFHWSEAQNGLEALQKVENRPQGFDAILMDLQMPIMTGIQSTRAIRLLEQERQVGDRDCYIIALTALSAEKDRLEAERAGVDLFLVKPMNLKELRKILHERVAAKQEREGTADGHVEVVGAA